MFLPLDFIGNIAQFVFGDAGYLLVWGEQDLFLNLRRQHQAVCDLVDPLRTHVKPACNLLQVFCPPICQHLLNLVRQDQVLSQLRFSLDLLGVGREVCLFQIFQFYFEFVGDFVFLEEDLKDSGGCVVADGFDM